MDKRPRTGATAILSELIKLKSHQKYLDASQMTLNPHKFDSKEEMAQINDVENLKTELDINLLAFVRDMHNETVHVMAQLKEFQATMLKPASVQQYNIKQYREQLFQLDRVMREADERNAMELKCLRHEYGGMEEELAALANENLLRQHRKSLHGKRNGVTMMRAAVSAPIDRNDNDDIKQFDRFVNERGGHTGGWSDEEHHLFIKLRTKYKSNIERICMEVQTVLAGVYECFLTSRHSGSGVHRFPRFSFGDLGEPPLCSCLCHLLCQSSHKLYETFQFSLLATLPACSSTTLLIFVYVFIWQTKPTVTLANISNGIRPIWS